MSHDPATIFYRNTDLDPGRTERLVADALNDCDDGELYLQYATSESFSFDDGRLKSATFDTTQGFGLRGVKGETTGFAHANELSDAAIARAADTVKVVASGHGGAVSLDRPPRTNAKLYTDADPLSAIPFAAKVELLQRIDAAARARDPRVVQVSASLLGSWSVVEIVRADGLRARDIRPLVRLNVSVVVANGDRRETGFHGLGGRYLYDDLMKSETWQSAIDTALAQALVNLEAVDAPAGEMTVVLGPGWPGILLHEAIGHGLEGDFNRKGNQCLRRADRPACCRARGDRGRRWRDGRTARLADDRR